MYRRTVPPKIVNNQTADSAHKKLKVVHNKTKDNAQGIEISTHKNRRQSLTKAEDSAQK